MRLKSLIFQAFSGNFPIHYFKTFPFSSYNMVRILISLWPTYPSLRLAWTSRSLLVEMRCISRTATNHKSTHQDLLTGFKEAIHQCCYCLRGCIEDTKCHLSAELLKQRLTTHF